jgi:hypothetical protein
MITVVLKECGFLKFLISDFNVSSISNQSFADASSSNITILTLPMPMACQEHLKEKSCFYRQNLIANFGNANDINRRCIICSICLE